MYGTDFLWNYIKKGEFPSLVFQLQRLTRRKKDNSPQKEKDTF
jgi:hypothetical protein